MQSPPVKLALLPQELLSVIQHITGRLLHLWVGCLAGLTHSVLELLCSRGGGHAVVMPTGSNLAALRLPLSPFLYKSSCGQYESMRNPGESPSYSKVIWTDSNDILSNLDVYSNYFVFFFLMNNKGKLLFIHLGGRAEYLGAPSF